MVKIIEKECTISQFDSTSRDMLAKGPDGT